MSALVLLGSFTIMLLLNIPIAIALGMSSVFTLIFTDLPLGMIPANSFAASSKFVLMAIPFFILSGNILERAGISEKLIRFCRTLVGHWKSGMATVCVLVACFFAAICGSGPATVAALGGIIIPAMVKAGYSISLSAALVAISGAIGLIIPPSISFVVYGSIAGASIGNLFIAGIIPGLMMGAALILATNWIMRKETMNILPRSTGRERWEAFKDAFWGILMPVIILGGIYGGVFTPTEAAVVSVFYGLFVGFFIYKTLNVKELWALLVTSSAQTAVVMFIIIAASLFAWVLTVEGMAAAASESLLKIAGGNWVVFLLLVNIILLIAGCLLDGSSAFFIFTPIMLPVALELGIDPIHLGVIMVMNLAIGLATPPVGINLYVACGISGLPLKTVAYNALPLVLASIVVLLFITYIPAISFILL